MLLFILFLFCASALASVPRMAKPLYSEELEQLERHFEEFIATHGKKYAHEAEKKLRFDIFKDNVAYINKRNADPNESAIFGIDKFSDLTREEFFKRYTGFRVPEQRPFQEYENVTHYGDLPEKFDWREYNIVSRVKDQLQCEGCWAFSAVGCVEAAYARKYGSVKDFSEQQLIDCDKKSDGCEGGYMQNGIQYIVDAGGIEGESGYPLKDVDEMCAFDKHKVQGKVMKMLPYHLKGEDDTKRLLISNGPIAIGLDANTWLGYHGGLHKYCTSDKLNHGVLLVGYGKDVDGTKYWIVKNSWSEGWGENGYINIAYSDGDNPCGMYNQDAAGALIL